jgi:peptide/nickel transport system permease protein
MSSVVQALPRRRSIGGLWSGFANLFGLVTLGVILAAALVPSAWLPHDPTGIDLSVANRPGAWAGNWEYPLGTDFLGRDMASRMVYGARLTLIISGVAVVIATALGTALGLMAGYFGRWVDDVVSWIIDVQLAFPVMALAVTVIAVLGGSVASLVLVLALTSWFTTARVVRSRALSLRQETFVEAARALGAGHGRILLHHVLPNVVSPILAVATFEMARLVLAESALSFLGLGVAPPQVTWGGMIGDGRAYIYDAWWTATAPGVLIALLVIAFNFVGDAVRDVLDPVVAVKESMGGGR